MLDLDILRTNPEVIQASLQRRGMEIDLAKLVQLDRDLRATRRQAELIRAEQKQAGKRIAQLDGAEKESAIQQASELAKQIDQLQARAAEIDQEFNQLWDQVPNLVSEAAADGFSEEDNQELRRVGEVKPFASTPLSFTQLGEQLDLIDTARAAEVSGSRFGYLKGPAVLLELGLVRWALDQLQTAGFTPMIPPVLVREEALYGTGFFPGDREQVYEVSEDDLFLVGTSEVALAAYHTKEILEPDSLPLRYAGFSTCFRREAGTYGKDTGSIFRVHQFDKLEMFVFCQPEDSENEHERLRDLEEQLVRGLEIPYRVVNVAAGDLGASAAKKYDIEAWFPSWGTYREITSCSNTTDFQARRLNIRSRGRGQTGNRLVHTLNGTAVAVGRTILALLENHQQPDGSVKLPEALVDYVGYDTIKSPTDEPANP